MNRRGLHLVQQEIPSIGIAQIYLTIGREGPLAGKPTVVVETTPLPKNMDAWRMMQVNAIFAEIQRLAPQPILVTFNNGPVLQDGIADLIDLGAAAGYTFCLEVPATTYKQWFDKLDYLIIASQASGYHGNLNKIAASIDCLANEIIFKCVVSTDDDYRFAQELFMRHDSIPMYLQVGHPLPVGELDLQAALKKHDWLVQKVLDDEWYQVVILPPNNQSRG